MFDNNHAVAKPLASTVRRKFSCTSNDTKAFLPPLVDSSFVTHTFSEDVVFDEKSSLLLSPSASSSLVVHLTFQKRTQSSDANVAINALEREIFFSSSTASSSSNTRKSSTMPPFGCAILAQAVPKYTNTVSAELDAITVSPQRNFVAY